jgi:hypothetical protein
MYGGKIDDDGNMETLSRIVKSVVSLAAYELDHYLVHAGDSDHGLKVSTGTTMPDFMIWAPNFPNENHQATWDCQRTQRSCCWSSKNKRL